MAITHYYQIVIILIVNMNKKYKVLFISSFPPERSAGLAIDYINALEEVGHEVDFLTLKGFPGQKENQYSIYKQTTSSKLAGMSNNNRLLAVIRTLKNRLFPYKNELPPYMVKNGAGLIVNINEKEPPIPAEIVTEKITKDYDFIITLFLQNMISAHSFLKIFEKTKSPIIILGVDMFAFTGGCFYFGDCRRFRKQCGKCPILESNDSNDQTHLNWKYKKYVYNNIKCVFCSNTHSVRYAKESGIFSRYCVHHILIDEKKFIPRNTEVCKKECNIPQEKRFVMFCGFSGMGLNKTKGYDYLLKSVNKFADNLNSDDKKSVILVIAGNEDRDFFDKFNVETYYFGRASMNQLISLYSAATVFLSPSVDDAGPSMVNQSIMCGTPVVSFNIGTAIDVIDNGVNGYKANLRDEDDFAKGIRMIYELSEVELQKYKNNCREIALKFNSRKSFVNNIEKAYNIAIGTLESD